MNRPRPRRKEALLWNLQWAKDYAWLRERFDAGEETPAIENQPQPAADVVYLLRMWNTLANCRPASFGGITGIPLSDIGAAFEIFNVGEFCPADEFFEWMLYLDGIARDYWNKKNKPENKKRIIIPP